MEGMARFLIVQDKLEPADVILVLAGDASGERVAEGVKLYKQGYAKKMLMSGGSLAWKLTSAEWMKKQALASGVPAKAILLEERSESTIENAKFTLPIVKKHRFKSIILVTSPTHSRRALRVFKKEQSREGIKLISHPVPLPESQFRIPDWWKRHEDTQAVMREYIAMVYYFLKGF